MKLGLLTAIWGRPRLTELVLRYYDEMPLDYKLQMVSDEDDYYPEYEGNWDWWVKRNDPLSNKWLAGLEYMIDTGYPDCRAPQDLDGIMIVGSDDLVNARYIEACKYLLSKGADYIYLPGCYFYNAPTREMIYGYTPRLGLGRVISRRLLDRLDWKPWPQGLNMGLDGAMWERVNELKGVRIVQLKGAREQGFAAMDIKTGDNIWSFDHIRENLVHDRVDAEQVLERFFPSVKDQLLNWSEYEYAN